MKTTTILLSAFAFVTIASADDLVTIEQAQKAARILTENLPSNIEAPIKVEADLEKPQGISGGEVKLLVIPDKNLTASALSEAGRDIVPVGQLWMHQVAIADQGKAISSEKVRRVSITDKNKDFTVALFFLGVRKSDQGALELVILSKDKVPLLRLPLGKDDLSQEFPITLSGRKESEESGTLTLHILGRHTAEIQLVKEQD